MKTATHQRDGAALAAILSAGLGCAAIGLMVVLAEAIPPIKEMLNWWSPAGPLTGKTGVGVIVWIVSWIFLHQIWRRREIAFRKIWLLALLLIVVGWIGTFPPVFEFFSSH